MSLPLRAIQAGAAFLVQSLYEPDALQPGRFASAAIQSRRVITSDDLITRLRSGDETAFARVVGLYHLPMLRVARSFVSDDGTAEDVVQETWLAVMRGLSRFEERSSLRTWLFRILVNRAKTRAIREARTLSFSELAARDSGGHDRPPDSAPFADEPPGWQGHWVSDPRAWALSTEDQAVMSETQECLRDAIRRLAMMQRIVIVLRDIEGWSADEVARLLEVTPVHQRVLLHRARSRVRAALAELIGDE